MNDKKTIVLLGLVLIGLFLWWKGRSGERPIQGGAEPLHTWQEKVLKEEGKEAEQEPEAVVSAPVPDVALPPSSEQAPDFVPKLEAMGKCLNFQPSTAGSSEPTLDNLLLAVKPEFNAPIIQSEDWSNTHIVLPNGEKRRIRIELEWTDERVFRRLSYFGVDKEDLPVKIPLPKEQSEDPSDTLIASLEGEGQVVLRERRLRLYFVEGEELIVTERNGRISELELTRGVKVFRCLHLNNSLANCACN
ncbi:MAG: hypothetical protein N2578_01825 [Bdellovibrionaceae bacterium]|nr:hypothetical protein [Pseudobdellovibrionaceae bacterium]